MLTKQFTHLFKFFTFIMLFIGFSSLNAQYHLDLFQSGNYDYQEIVNLSEIHFNKIGKGKGLGYKQFERWRYWAERNLDENGKVRNDKESLDDFLKFSKLNGSNNKNLTGSYIELGPLSTINTATWSSALGRVSAIGLDANDDNHIIVGSPSGGIWNTYDLGDSWTPLFDDQALIDVYSLEISHSNADHYFAGLSRGVVRSTNAGLTWTAVAGLSSTQLYNTITMHPTDPNILFAVAQSSGIVYKSVDGGDNFYAVMDHTSSMYDLEFHPSNPSIIYTSGNDAVYKSIDGGENFTVISTGLWSGSGNTIMLAVTPAAAENIYALEELSGGFNALYLSQDGGATWSTLSDNTCGCNNIMGYDQNTQSGQAPRDMDIIVSPVNPNIVHVAGVETWRSNDLGQNWTQTTFWNNPGGSNFIHADIDLLIYDGNRIVAGTDGGIYYSTDEATSWTDITFGLGIRQFYRIGASQTDIDRISGGSQDNGTGVLRDGNWYDYAGADGMETFIDWSNEDIIYCTSQYGNLYKSIDGGNTRTSISTPSGGGNWVTPLEQDPINSNTLYTARQQVFKSTNGGSTWTAISNFNSGSADEMKIAPTDNQYIYVSYGNTIYSTTNGGGSWTSNTLPGSRVNYIAMHPTDPLRLTVALSGTSSKIMESTDGGLSWANVTANIPNVAIECVYYEESANGGLYAGGNPGIYYTAGTTSASWSTITNNLPKVRVTEFEIRNQILYVATYGRGLWKYELVCDGTLAGQSCNDLDICTINDVFDVNCECAGTPAPDGDQDGVCDLADQCPGFDDNQDMDLDGIPDGCDASISCVNCVSTVNTFPYTEDFENGTGNLCQFDSDDIDWTINSGTTPSSETGPSAAYSGSNYFYVETSSPNYPSKIAIYKSPCLNLTNATTSSINFWYHMYGVEMGELELLISTDNGVQWVPIWSKIGNQGNQWVNVNLDLTQYVGGTFSFAFRGTTGLSFTSDFSLDLITIDAAVGCGNSGGDIDGDGVCSDADCDDNDPNIGGAGSACDDGDPCTINDIYDVSCNCSGTIEDADGDGICAANDCDDNDASIGGIGSSCDDGNVCTINDTTDANCNCIGTVEDVDADGVCAAEDCDDNDPNIGGAGSTCDDGDPCTINDIYDVSCNCSGTIEDADGDGICVNDDCNDNDSSIGMIGSTCDDGDACTIDDILDSNCICIGTFEDSDGDGVCDSDDICEGGDDNQDSDNNGIPDFCDCSPTSNSMPVNPLTHSGAGSSSTTLNLNGVHTDVSFVISNLNSKLNGSPAQRFDEQVVVNYTDIDGAIKNYGTFLGSITSTVNVNIAGVVQSISISLSDAYDGNSGNVVMSISFSPVSSCSNIGCPDADSDGICDDVDQCPGVDDGLIGTACDDGNACTINDSYDSSCNCIGIFEDSDGDGVCDADDICEGGDDTTDSDGDGIPDFCDCNLNNDSFSPSTLSHSGTGSSSTSVSFSAASYNVAFDITNLNAKTNGSPSGRFIDIVDVDYIDDQGQLQSYGSFSGANTNSVSVLISQSITSVIVTLSDGYDGDSPTISVNLSVVSSCSTVAQGGSENENSFSFDNSIGSSNSKYREIGNSEDDLFIFPNPAQDEITLRLQTEFGLNYQIEVINILGESVISRDLNGTGNQKDVKLNTSHWLTGMYFVLLKTEDHLEIKTVVIQRD